jgi:Protein of unknown function (DUF1588)/Protein of unknown function (DUF1592)/Protein of unknown function (DUF1595)/Protein of unknown function (DUF1587)/Protein of unknown function (DUF1585)
VPSLLLFALACRPGGAEGTLSPQQGSDAESATAPPPVSVPDAGPSEPAEPACGSVTPRRLRRITQTEYQRIVEDLIGAAIAPVDWAAPDPLVHGFDNDAEALLISDGNFEDFARSAQTTADGADVATLAPCAANEVFANCGAKFATSFATRAYGRPPSAAETKQLSALYQIGAEDGYAQGIRLVIEAVLMSPHFLYRSELGPESPPTSAEISLTPLEFANALAFALTGERPDPPLLERAQTDPSFSSRAVLRQEAQRLSETKAAHTHFARFLRGWLGVLDLRSVNKIPSVFPDFTPALKADLDTEMSLFVDRALKEGGGTLEQVLGAPVTFSNKALLTSIYANDYADSAMAPALPGDGSFAEITLNPTMRRGILSLGGWLAAHSPVHRSSPVDRGLAIRNRLFCQSLSPPPPSALASAPGPGDATGTTRQKFEQHSTDPQCQGCHKLMDPIGFGFEMMDALGRYRTTEADLPVDSSGILTGTDVDGPFTGPADLAGKLIGSRKVRDCFVLQMFRYVEGRDEQPADACSLLPLQKFFAPADTRISDLAVEMVLRGTFSKRSTEP